MKATPLEVIHTWLTNEVPVCIRRVRVEDEQRLKDGIALLSHRSRYLRFFTGMREAPQRVIDALVDVDGHDHIAWGALRSDVVDTPALGVVHAIRDAAEPTEAEFSVAVIDAYHGKGLARLLAAVLLLDCRREGLQHLTVHVLGENAAARALAKGLRAQWVGHEMAVQVFDIEVARAIVSLEEEDGLPGLQPIFEHFRA